MPTFALFLAVRHRAALLGVLFAAAAVASTPADAAPRRHKTAAASARTQGTPYADDARVRQFAEEAAARRSIDREWLRRMVAQAQQVPSVIRLVQPAPAATPKNWRVYRSRFIEPIRIGAGVRFWQTHRDTLARAEQEFGVPAEIIVGVIGVETVYGQHMGDYRVIDALATLAFDFPPSHPRAAERAAYFRGELEQFLLWHHQHGSDPLLPRGSYAGAVGLPQFMPTSLARWAVDYDGDSQVDLVRSAPDAIGSVASYLKGYGWRTGMPTHYPVGFDRARLDLDALLAPDILPTFGVASFQARGAVLDGAALEHAGPLALIELQNGGDAPSYVAGTENFYVVTRYNWSSYYAMAVIELGREVREALARAP